MTQTPTDNVCVYESRLDGMVGNLQEEQGAMVLSFKKYTNLNQGSILNFYNWMFQLKNKTIGSDPNITLYSKGRSTLTNAMRIRDYYDNYIISNTFNDFITNPVGKQLNQTVTCNDNFISYLKQTCNVSDEEERSLIQMLTDNLQKGYTFGNNIDCLFQNTWGMFIALYYNTPLSKQNDNDPLVINNPVSINQLYDDVVTKFKESYMTVDYNVGNLDKYYSKVIINRFDNDSDTKFKNILEDFKNKLKFRDMNIFINDEKNLNEVLRRFLTETLKSNPDLIGTYNNTYISAINYYYSKLNISINGTTFPQIYDDTLTKLREFRKKKQKKEFNDTRNAYSNNYGYISDAIIKYFQQGNYANSYDSINFSDYRYLIDIIESDIHDATKKQKVDDFIESALNFIVKLVSSLNARNFIYYSSFYRAVCLLLMYWFTPTSIYDEDLTLSAMIWGNNNEGDYGNPNDILVSLAHDYMDHTINIPGHQRVNYMICMVYNEVFSTIALKLFPRLKQVYHLQGKYNQDIDIIQNCLYIIRPLIHDHTFTVAKVGDYIYWCDDFQESKHAVAHFLYPYKTNRSNPNPYKVYTDLYDHFIKHTIDTKPSFIAYYNNNTVLFPQFIMFSNYINVIKMKGNYKQFKRIIEAIGSPNKTDFSDTLTNQIYGQGKPSINQIYGQSKDSIIDINWPKFIIMIIIIGVVIFVVVKYTKKCKNINKTKPKT